MMSRLRHAFRSLKTDRRATTMLDYGLVAALTSLALASSLQTVGVSVNGVFAELTAGIAQNVVQYQPDQHQP